MNCPSCGNTRKVESCACGAKSSGLRVNGDIGFQINLGKRKLQPKFIYSGGKLKKARG